MTTVTIIAFFLISFMVLAILIKLGYLIYEAIVLGCPDYEGHEMFFSDEDSIDVADDVLRYDPIEIEIIDRVVAYEQS